MRLIKEYEWCKEYNIDCNEKMMAKKKELKLKFLEKNV